MRRTLFIVLFSFATLAVAQQTRQDRKRDQKLSRELESGYDGFLQDVGYIISDAERQSFHRLSNSDERDQFIEQFWLRRDPTPDTVENEFKEEHYRRLAYANERFASGIPGRQTDRGMIYIKYGPPDEIESHPAGGSYQRPVEEGGGQTTTYPFEVWRYRYIEGIGTNVLIDFVDQSGTGVYRIATDPQDKDALQHTPGYVAPSQPFGSNQFDRITLFAALTKPPSVKFKDLEAAVNTNIRYNTLPIQVRTDYIPVTPTSVLSNITIQFDRRDLQFQESGGSKAVVNLYARISTLSRRAVTVFEDVLTVDGTSPLALYQKSVPLAPGKYRLSIAARDVVGGGTATYESAIDVPPFSDDELAASSLILADLIEKLPSRTIGTGQFVIGDTKVRPRVSETFTTAENLGVYVQLHHLSRGSIAYDITNVASNESALAYTEDVTVAAAQCTVQKWFSLKDLPPANYIFRMKVTDRATGHAITRIAAFRVEPASPL